MIDVKGLFNEIDKSSYEDFVKKHSDLLFLYNTDATRDGKSYLKNAILIRDFIEKSPLTIAEIAGKAGVHRNTIYNMTKGYCFMTNDTIAKIGEATGIKFFYPNNNEILPTWLFATEEGYTEDDDALAVENLQVLGFGQGMTSTDAYKNFLEENQVLRNMTFNKVIAYKLDPAWQLMKETFYMKGDMKNGSNGEL